VRRRRARQPTVANVDLTAVLSVVVHLIPMLLLLVRFRQIAQLDASGGVVPALPAPSAVALAEQADRIVSVRITGQGFYVGGAGDTEPFLPCAGTCAAETYDYTRLAQTMLVAKDLHPDERRVVLVPSPEVPYDVVVDVIDAVRARDVGGKEVPLFPVPLIAAPEPAPASP
jgi:biopolymer transport protein ExbD